MFNSVKVVHLSVPKLPEVSLTASNNPAADAKVRISRLVSIAPELQPPAQPKKIKISAIAPALIPKTVKPKMITPKTAVGFKNTYAVQLATFAHLKNAISLVSNLKKRGYQVYYYPVTAKNGIVFYRVIVGSYSVKIQAQNLQKRLAQLTRIDGFVVPLRG